MPGPSINWSWLGNAIGGAGKMAVIGAIGRKGNVVARTIEKINIETVDAFVSETVSTKVKLIASDEANAYRGLRKRGLPHKSVNHGRGEYVRGNVHTANIDSFWSMIKRGIMGSFHQVSKGYLPLYLNEFAFRYNNRKNADIFAAVVASA
jgi:transposase-like protein